MFNVRYDINKKKYISLLLIVTMILCFLSPNKLYASENGNNIVIDEISSDNNSSYIEDEEILNEELEEDSEDEFEIDDVENEEDEENFDEEPEEDDEGDFEDEFEIDNVENEEDEEVFDEEPEEDDEGDFEDEFEIDNVENEEDEEVFDEEPEEDIEEDSINEFEIDDVEGEEDIENEEILDEETEEDTEDNLTEEIDIDDIESEDNEDDEEIEEVMNYDEVQNEENVLDNDEEVLDESSNELSENIDDEETDEIIEDEIENDNIFANEISSPSEIESLDENSEELINEEIEEDLIIENENHILNEASPSELNIGIDMLRPLTLGPTPSLADTTIYWAYYDSTKELLIGKSTTVFPTSGLTLSGNYPCDSANYAGLTKSNVKEILVYDSVAPSNMSHMFTAFNNVEKIDFNGNMNTLYSTSFNNCFSHCSVLKEIDLSDFSYSSIIDESSLDAIFAVSSKLHTIYVTNTSDLMPGIYGGINMFTSTNLIGGQGASLNSYIGDIGTVLRIDKHNDNVSNAGLFTEKGTDIYWIYDESNNEMVFGPSKDTTWFSGINGINYSYQVNTSRKLGSIISQNYTYGNISSLSWQDASYFDKSIVKSVRFLPNTKPVNMCEWFKGFSNLESINFNNIDCSLLVNMYATCKDCTSLKTVTFGSLDTSNVQVMESMFEGCSELETLDLRSFNTTSLNDSASSSGSIGAIEKMFYGCTNLKKIYALERTVTENDFTLCNNTLNSNMFVGCDQLVGSMGTRHSVALVNDNTYALVDDGVTGYFSLFSVPPIPDPPTPHPHHPSSGGGGGGGSSVIPVYDSKELVVKPSDVLDNTDVWTTNMGIYRWIDGTCKIAYVLYNFYQDKFYFYDENIMKIAEIYKYLEANQKVQFDNIVSNNVVTNQWVGISYLPDVITWYYVDNNGEKVTGWELINDNMYYFNSEGKMLTGVQYIDNQLYHFNIIKGTDEGKLLIDA